MKKAILAAALVCAAGTTYAQENPRWNFVNLSFNSFDVGGRASSSFGDNTGVGIAGSILVTENIFATASYKNVSDSYSGFDFDQNYYSVGAGWRQALPDNLNVLNLPEQTDVFAIASYDHFNTESEYASYFGSYARFSTDSSSLALRGGLRTMIRESVELNGIVGLTVGDENDIVVGVGAQYYFMDQASVGLNIERTGPANMLSVGLNYYF